MSKETTNFIAPPEIETEIIDYCVETLKLSIGEFWYKWFDSNKDGNHTIHIDTNNSSLQETITKTFSDLDFVDKIFKVQKCDYMPGEDIDDFKFQYYIHFKAKANVTQIN